MSENILDDQAVLKTISKYLQSDKFHLKTWDIRSASDEVLGFMGEHTRLNVNFALDGIDKSVTFFAKKIPTKNKTQREYAEKSKCFYKEIELYKTLFEDFKNARSLTAGSWCPKCFYTRDWTLLIFEDLSPLGFSMIEGRALLDKKHCLVTLKTLAKMHASSIIFEENLKSGKVQSHSPLFGTGKTMIGDLYPNLIFESECTNEVDHPGFTFWEVSIRSQLAIVDLLPGYTDQQKEKIKNSFPDTMRTIYELVKPSNKYRNVLTHGDLWGNNVLFRYNDSREPVEAILVDFQMARYAPPALELMMFLYVVQDDEFRKLYEAEVLKFFYECLETELKGEGLNINELLPEKEYYESCEFYRGYAVLNQITYAQLNLTPPDLANIFMATQEAYDKFILEDRSELLVESFLTDDLCRTRNIEAMNNVINMFKLA